MTKREDSSYLWDGSGMPDPEVVRLETLLSQLRHDGALAPLPVRQPRQGASTRTVALAVAAAAAVVLIAGILWSRSEPPRAAWSVQTIAGAPVVDGTQGKDTPAAADRLGVGEWIVTDAV